MLSIDIPAYGTGVQPITFHVRVHSGQCHLEVTYRRSFDGSVAGVAQVGGTLTVGDYDLVDHFNTSEVYYSSHKFVEDATVQYTLTIQSSLGGTTNPPPGTYRYSENESVVVEAVPTSHYNFSGWTVNSLPQTQNPITLVMIRNVVLVAMFTAEPTMDKGTLECHVTLKDIEVAAQVRYDGTVATTPFLVALNPNTYEVTAYHPEKENIEQSVQATVIANQTTRVDFNFENGAKADKLSLLAGFAVATIFGLIAWKAK